MDKKDKPRKRKKDPRYSYYVIDTYNENAEKTLEEILTSKEFVELIYKIMKKYGSPDDDDKKLSEQKENN